MNQKNKKIIFGFTGLIASGKGTAAKYIEQKYSAANLRFSTMLRDVLSRLYLPQSRDMLVKLSETIRANFGEDSFAKVMAQDAKNNKKDIIVIEGIRRPADITYLSKLPNFVLVEIFADPKIRYERLIKRGENADDNTKTYEQFLEDHKRSTELSILDVLKSATEHIDNNGSTEDLHNQLDKLVKKYAGTN